MLETGQHLVLAVPIDNGHRVGHLVTVVDSSPEAVDIARSKVSGDVGWQVADVFEFRPERTYDTVSFSFWLSHVPIERFASFWELVGECVGHRNCPTDSG